MLPLRGVMSSGLLDFVLSRRLSFLLGVLSPSLPPSLLTLSRRFKAFGLCTGGVAPALTTLAVLLRRSIPGGSGFPLLPARSNLTLPDVLIPDSAFFFFFSPMSTRRGSNQSHCIIAISR